MWGCRNMTMELLRTRMLGIGVGVSSARLPFLIRSTTVGVRSKPVILIVYEKNR